jgi:hypothetical protein
MRIPSLLFLALFVASVPAGAQDLQFRMRMETSVPGMAEVPTSKLVTTISIKGKKVRMDQDIGMAAEAMQASVIMDDSAGKAFMLLHEDKSYMEVPIPLAAARTGQDSMKLKEIADKGGRTIRTGEKQTIAGYVAERRIMMFEAPAGMPSMGNSPSIIIQDAWVSRDPAVMAAYRGYAERAAALGAAAGPASALLNADAYEFPLRTVMMIVQGASNKDTDPVSLLKQENPPGMMMRMAMEVTEVKLAALPDSLFVLPSGYSKTQ